jgi:hypothetical protein
LGSIVLFPVCGCKVRYFLGIVQIFLPFFLKKIMVRLVCADL